MGDVLIERGVDYGLSKLVDVYQRRPTIEPHAVAAGRLWARTITEAAQTIPGAVR